MRSWPCCHFDFVYTREGDVSRIKAGIAVISGIPKSLVERVIVKCRVKEPVLQREAAARVPVLEVAEVGHH